MENEKYAALRKKKKRRQARRLRRLLLTAECIVAAVLTLVLVGLTKLDNIDHLDLGTVAANQVSEAAKITLKGYTNIALFGIDNRSNGSFDSGQSDVIMVCSINNDTKEIHLVSVYRDTLMDVDGNGKYRKCNYAYNHGGPKAAVEMLNRNLDLDIKDFVSVDFRAVAEAVDAVGGIDLTITDDEIDPPGHHPGINAYIDEVADVTGRTAKQVQSGSQHVDGVQATAYCRLRYTASMDFGRAARQRIVLQKLFEKVKSASLKEQSALIDTLFSHISTSFTTGDLLVLAGAMKDYTIAPTAGYPFAKSTATPSNTIGSVVVPCNAIDNVKKLYSVLFGDENHEVSSTVENISTDIEDLTGLSAEDAVSYDPAYEDASGSSVMK